MYVLLCWTTLFPQKGPIFKSDDLHLYSQWVKSAVGLETRLSLLHADDYARPKKTFACGLHFERGHYPDWTLKAHLL